MIILQCISVADLHMVHLNLHNVIVNNILIKLRRKKSALKYYLINQHLIKSIFKPVNPKGNQSWIFTGRTDAEAEAPILWPPDAKSRLWKRPWCWERVNTGGEGDDRGQDGWTASPTQWTWVWANSGRWWRKAKPGMLGSMGSQRAGHDWVTEQQTVYMMRHNPTHLAPDTAVRDIFLNFSIQFSSRQFNSFRIIYKPFNPSSSVIYL